MDLYKAVNEFAKYMHPKLNTFDCDDLVLFGSLARNSKTPNDIDLMIIHHNPALDKLEEARLEKKINGDYHGFVYANELLKTHGYPSIEGIALIPSCREALHNGVLGLTYLNNKFFTDENYKNLMTSKSTDPNFYHNVFKTGFLWNPASQKFNIRATEKYPLPEMVEEKQSVYRLNL